jgi:peptidoglycan/xylan/chitin deacetylase (PgdA/CDA1 family)
VQNVFPPNGRSSRIALPVAFACAGVAISLASVALWGTLARRAQVFGASVFEGPGRRRSVALTFDDGPSRGSLEIAAYLAQQGIHATFFQCGANVLRHPEIARELAAGGHELGNHTFLHPRLCPRLGFRMNLRWPEKNRREFELAQAVIIHATGVTPKLLRAPYGLRWWGMRGAQRRLGLLGVMWTVIAHDWEWNEEDVATHVLHHAAPGGIVCLHDGRETRPDPDIGVTLRALRLIVPALRQMGYSFETVTELLRADQAASDGWVAYSPSGMGPE